MNWKAGLARTAAVGLMCGMLEISTAAAQAPGPLPGLPNVVIQPFALNMGGSTFFDGFAPPVPGWIYIQTFRAAAANRVLDANGQDSPLFKNPKVTTEASINQAVYTSPITLGPGLLGMNFILPVVNVSTHFDPPGLILKSSGAGLGDLTFGPFLQSLPIMNNGRPLFAWRLALDITAPTGKFDKFSDINPSVGYWYVNPSLAMSYFPTEKIELSARLNYIYNFQTSNFANPPPIPGLVYNNGQAGQMAWITFDGSYGVTDKLNVGVNGYYAQQFTDNRLNGTGLAATRQEQLYFGPGFRYAFDRKNYLNVNFYLPVTARNVATGPQLNLQYIHPF